MLSGQITVHSCKDALEVLLDDLDETVKDLLRRNLRLLENQRGSSTLSYEQMQLVRCVVEHPEDFLSWFMPAYDRAMVDLLVKYAEEAELEVRR